MIDSRLARAVMADYAAGVPVAQIAAAHNLSVEQVHEVVEAALDEAGE